MHAVGWAASTFSISLRERRMMDGAPAATMRLVKFDWDLKRGSEKLVPDECKGE
jgi:hypothetical protein